MARVASRTSISGKRGTVTRYSDASSANTALTVSTEDNRRVRVKHVTIAYSAAVTLTVTVTLNSGAGATYDCLLDSTDLANETDYFWLPTEDVILQPQGLMDDGQTQNAGDAIDVLAPAGGAGVTSQVTIVTEVF